MLYVMVKRININLAHAFMRNFEGKSNKGYAMVLTKIFERVKIDFKSKVRGKYKGDFELVTLKRMKLPAVSPSEEFAVIGDTMKEKLEREEAECPHLF